MKKIKNIKDIATNVAGVLILFAGAVGAVATAGVSIPVSLGTAATISGTLGAWIVARFTGKNPDGSTKSESQIEKANQGK